MLLPTSPQSGGVGRGSKHSVTHGERQAARPNRALGPVSVSYVQESTEGIEVALHARLRAIRLALGQFAEL